MVALPIPDEESSLEVQDEMQYEMQWVVPHESRVETPPKPQCPGIKTLLGSASGLCCSSPQIPLKWCGPGMQKKVLVEMGIVIAGR